MAKQHQHLKKTSIHSISWAPPRQFRPVYIHSSISHTAVTDGQSIDKAQSLAVRARLQSNCGIEAIGQEGIPPWQLSSPKKSQRWHRCGSLIFQIGEPSLNLTPCQHVDQTPIFTSPEMHLKTPLLPTLLIR